MQGLAWTQAEVVQWVPLVVVAAVVVAGVVVVVDVVDAAAAAEAAVVAVADAAAAALQGSESCVGASGPVGTGRSWVAFGAPHQEKCYSSLHHVVAAWMAAVASVVAEVPDSAMVRAC